MVKDHFHSERGNPLPHIGYSFRLAARILLYAPSHRQDSTYHSLCYTSRGALAGTRDTSWINTSMWFSLPVFVNKYCVSDVLNTVI